MSPLIALVVTFGLMYVLLIRPQQRKLRQHQAVVASLRAGDEIVTAGGIYGTIVSVGDETMVVEVAPGVELRILRAAVSQRLERDEPDEEAGAEEEAGERGALDPGEPPGTRTGDNGRGGVVEPAQEEEN